MPKVARKKPQALRQPSAASSGSCLYLGCFFFDKPGEPERTGTFQIVVEAASPEQAVERCESRLRNLRTTTTLFDDPTTIYLEGIIKLTGSFEDGLLVNWQSGASPPPPHATISCLIPEQEDHGAESFGFTRESKKKKNNDTMEWFLDFGGMKFRGALERAGKDRSAESTTFSGVVGSFPPRTTALPTPARVGPAPASLSVVPASAATQEAEQKSRRAAADARKQRREALAATVAELKATNRKERGRGADEGPTKRSAPKGSSQGPSSD